MKTIVSLMMAFLPFIALSQQPDNIYGDEKARSIVNDQMMSNEDYKAGSNAAIKYFHAKPAGTATFLATGLVNPVIGLAPAIAISSSTPNKVTHPNGDKMKNEAYYQGYTNTAKRLKNRAVWRNFAAGSVLYAILITGVVVSAR